MPLNLTLTGALFRRKMAGIDASVFDGGTITLYTGSVETDAGDLLASGTLPAKAFENESGGDRALHGEWEMVATKNGTARGLLLSNVGATIKVWLTVGTSATDVIIDHTDVQIGDIITIATMTWTLEGDSLLVTGTVVDNTAAAVSGAKVYLLDSDDAEVDSTTTDASGNYELAALETGAHTVRIRAPFGKTLGPSGDDEQSVTVNGGQSPVDFTLGTDIYHHSFEDGTQGDLRGESTASMFDVTNGLWVLDTTTAAIGTKSVKQTYPNSGPGVNVGKAFVYDLPSAPMTELYVRFAFKQSNPFNLNNIDGVKVMRYRGNPDGAPGSPFGIQNDGSGEIIMGTDNVSDGHATLLHANTNLPCPSANDILGAWHWYEGYIKIEAGACVYRAWIDGVLYFDYTENYAGIDSQTGVGAVFGHIQFDGTINSVQADNSTQWYDAVSFATERMGMPAEAA